MTFNKIYTQFIEPTKENFPVKDCVHQNAREPNVFESKVAYLCLLIDRRFNNDWRLIILYPYICKESDNITTFGWIDKDGNVYCNIENSTQLWDEFVIGFQKYDENLQDDKIWEDFIEKIDMQYEM